MTVRVAIDLDGVMYEWDKTARYLLREVRNLGHPELQSESTSWDMIEEVVGKREWDWLWTEGVKAGLFRYGHTVQGAQLGVRRLKARGHDLSVVTHRPAQAVQDTLAWLDLFFGREDPYPWSAIHILSHGEPKTSVPWDVLVDDKPNNIYQASRNDRAAILFKRPWNDGAWVPGGVHVADGWRGVAQW